MKRKIIVYRDRFNKFYNAQNLKTQLKIEYVLDIIRFEKHIPAKFLKYLINSEGIYEIRIITTFKNIRILCFFDQEDLVVLTNCFVKKTNKTPNSEIRMAKKIKQEYLINKYGG